LIKQKEPGSGLLNDQSDKVIQKKVVGLSLGELGIGNEKGKQAQILQEHLKEQAMRK
jgi:hypothetical protein